MSEQVASTPSEEVVASVETVVAEIANEAAPSAPEGEQEAAPESAPEGETESAPTEEPKEESATEIIGDLKATLASLQGEIAALKANQLSIDEAVAAKAAAIASRSSSAPVNVSPDNAEAQSLESVLAEIKATTSPTEKYRLGKLAEKLRAQGSN
jgi:hypothetical protein